MSKVNASDRRRAFKARTHGMTHSRVFEIWMGIHKRCSNPAYKSFNRYGGRGITVCDRWRTFDAFLADMGEPPSDKHTIERIDNDGHYEPGNCSWVTLTQQARNRSNNHVISFNGETRTLIEWEEITGIPQSLIRARLGRLGWSAERALTTPRNRNLGPKRNNTHSAASSG